ATECRQPVDALQAASIRAMWKGSVEEGKAPPQVAVDAGLSLLHHASQPKPHSARKSHIPGRNGGH
ncbi:hypothetical protein P7K49_032407, partial [Saguinus oedipus]